MTPKIATCSMFCDDCVVSFLLHYPVVKKNFLFFNWFESQNMKKKVLFSHSAFILFIINYYYWINITYRYNKFYMHFILYLLYVFVCVCVCVVWSFRCIKHAFLHTSTVFLPFFNFHLYYCNTYTHSYAHMRYQFAICWEL